MTETNLDCLQCGACCLLKGAFRYEGRTPVTKMCEHLIGVPMEKVFCAIYDSRPEVCREFRKDGDGCHAMRSWYKNFTDMNNGQWDAKAFIEEMQERYETMLATMKKLKEGQNE